MYKNNKSKLDEFISELNNRFSFSNRINKNNDFKQCESEIEKYFLTGYFYRCLFDEVFNNAKVLINNSILNLSVEKVLDGSYNYLATDILLDHNQVYFIFPQYQIDNFRVDFLLMVLYKDQDKIIVSPKLVVECDGFEYHDKTVDLIEKDKQRDQYLKNKGFEVLRFSGKQLYHNPFECALYTENLLKNTDFHVYNDPKNLHSKDYKSFKHDISIKNIEKLRTEKQNYLIFSKNMAEQAMLEIKNHKESEISLSPEQIEFKNKLTQIDNDRERIKTLINNYMLNKEVDKAKELIIELTRLNQEKNNLKINYYK